MGECIKCGFRPAKYGGLCEYCAKGAYRGVQNSVLPEGEKLTFEEFKKKYLSNVPQVQALSRADDELMLYQYYNKYGIFLPNLREDGSYKKAYSKLENWFSHRFFKILKERIASTQPKSIEYYDKLEENFMKFRKSINKIFLDMVSDEYYMQYIGIANVNPILIFLKKTLRSNFGENTIENYADYVDTAASIFLPGSAMFFLELYALMNDIKILHQLQKLIEKTDSETAKNIVKKPMVLLTPWTHQKEAFKAWKRNGGKGIIEMATATGKTLVGLMAIESLAKNKGDGRVLILAHSRAILNQWRRETIDKLGLIANPQQDYNTPIYCNGLKIYFNTLQTVYKKPWKYSADLLIVDEVHHGAASEFRKALSINTKWKMGLSATIEGEPRTQILKREIGPIVYRFTLKEAIKRGVIPKFEWKLHTVYLSIEEEKEFKEISEKIKNLFKKIRYDGDNIKKISDKKDLIEDLYDFIKLLEMARYKKLDLPEDWKILQSLILQRRWIIHRSKPKLEHAIELSKKLSVDHKVIIFTMDINSCDLIAEELSKEIDNVFVIHSDIEEDVNTRIIRFKKAKYGALIGARMLDEGIDIPDAEIGINISSSKTRLQLVQRIGRILRKQKDKKPVFHHYIAIPDPDYYLKEEDNFTFLDDLSWVQDTALKMGINAELDEETPIKELRMDAEKMIQRRFFKKEIPHLPGYGTFKLKQVLKMFPTDAINNMLEELNAIDASHKITDKEWRNIVRRANNKKEDEPLNMPGYWWILVLGDRNPRLIEEILKKYEV
ncbi:MAG: DEAD/DEAH box helicase [Thermoplasmata archaeon]|nr:MAG: DEAD/DEAH box helicase [Thermoplasmata archaeon]